MNKYFKVPEGDSMDFGSLFKKLQGYTYYRVREEELPDGFEPRFDELKECEVVIDLVKSYPGTPTEEKLDNIRTRLKEKYALDIKEVEYRDTNLYNFLLFRNTSYPEKHPKFRSTEGVEL